MRAISLWRPWAQWVALTWKVIETRTHSRFHGLDGERIAIHAAQKWDRYALQKAMPWLNEYQIDATMDMPRQTGIICTARVWKVRFLHAEDAPGALIECDTPRYGLFLCDVEPLILPKIKGKQGIFHIPHRE